MDRAAQEEAMVQGPQPLMNPNLDDLPSPEREYGPVANIWWSQRANEEHRLQQMRPSDLPSLQSGESGSRSGEQAEQQSGDRDERGLMSGSVSSQRHGFVAPVRSVEASTARLLGEIGSFGRHEPEYFNLATDDSAAGSSERFQDIDEIHPSIGNPSQGNREAQQTLHFSSNPGACLVGPSPPVATRVHPSSAMSFGPQGYPSQNVGDGSSGIQRSAASAVVAHGQTGHSFGVQVDHQIRNTPARDLYGIFEQEGRSDPMLLGLIRRLEEAEARARLASTMPSIGDPSIPTGKVPMYRSGPGDEMRSSVMSDTLPTTRVVSGSVGDGFASFGLEAGRYESSAGLLNRWTSEYQPSVPKIAHDRNFGPASGVSVGNWSGFPMRGPCGAHEGEQGINPARNRDFLAEQGPGLGHVRSGGLADVSDSRVDNHHESSWPVAVMPQLTRKSPGAVQGWQSSRVEWHEPRGDRMVWSGDTPSLIGDEVFRRQGEGNPGFYERSEVVMPNRVWDEPISLLDLDPIPITPASPRPSQVPLIDVLSPKSHATTPFAPVTVNAPLTGAVEAEPPRTPRVGTSLGHVCTPGGTRVPDGPPPCTPPSKTVSFGDTIPIPPSPIPGPPAPPHGMPGVSTGVVRPEEPSKLVHSLPVLNVTEGSSDASVVTGDWLARLGPVMRSMSPSAAIWWQQSLQSATDYYNLWLKADPLERLEIKSRAIAVTRDWGGLALVEERAAVLLLQAIPADLQSEAVSVRALSTVSLLFLIYSRFQPGGSSEKASILAYLTQPSVEGSPGVVSNHAALRKWERLYRRCVELGLSPPDPTLLVRALDSLGKVITNKSTHAAFRLSTYRLQSQLDSQPSESSVLQFCQLLTAELETLMLSGSETKQQRVAAVRVEADEALRTPSKPKGPPVRDPKTPSPKPASANSPPNPLDANGFCRFFSSLHGCRFGKTCKHPHPSLAPTDNRCFNCGASGHAVAACDKPGGGSAQSVGPGGDSKHKSVMPSLPKPSKPDAPAMKGRRPKGRKLEVDAAATSGQDDNQTSSNAADQGELQSQGSGYGISLKAIGVDGGNGLIDGGATHCLRYGAPHEYAQAREVQVRLASGDTQELRMSPVGTLLSPDPTIQPILAMGLCASELHCRIVWEKTQCSVYHPQLKDLPIMMRGGCPEISSDLCLLLIREIEAARGDAMLRSVRSGVLDTSADWLVLEGWEFLGGLMEWVNANYAQVPENLRARLVPNRPMSPGDSGLNRHSRRRLQRGGAMVHLFAGSQRWEHPNGNPSVSLDISRGFDIVDDALFHYLLELGRAGAIEALIGALPSDTFWFGGADDRKRLRDGSSLGRFGAPTLTDEERFNVDQDTVRILRFMILADVSVMGLKHRHGDRTDSRKVDDVLLVLEHPEEVTGSKDEVKAPSLWSWPEVESFKTRWELHKASFHQGMLGDYRVRPSSILTSSSYLWERLHLLKIPHSLLEGAQNRGGEGMKAVNARPVHSEWPRGLVSCIREALHDWSKGWEHIVRSSEFRVKRLAHLLANSGMPMVTDTGICIRKLSKRALEQFRKHCLAGHRPWRPDCAACLDAMAFCKPHRRLKHTRVCGMNVDLSGPHRTSNAEDQDISKPRYFMVCSYAYPIFKAAAADAKAHDHAIPPSGEFSEGEADGTAEDDGGGVGSVQDNEWETPEVDDPAFVLSESDKGRIKSENDKWRVIAEGCTEVAHEVIDIPMVEILPTKSAKAIVSALNKFYARLRSWGLPVYRMHSDRARELTDPLVTQWAAHRGIYKTTTAPEQPAGNGRAERLVGKLKQQTRALLHSTDAGSALWPHAIRYSCEGLQRAQLHRLGMDVQPLVPFYSLVKFRARTWRDEQWGTRASEGRLVAPCTDISKGYVVRVHDAGTPRLYATTLVYRNFVPEPEPPKGEASEEPAPQIYTTGAILGRPAPAEAEEILRLPETAGVLKAFNPIGSQPSPSFGPPVGRVGLSPSGLQSDGNHAGLPEQLDLTTYSLQDLDGYARVLLHTPVSDARTSCVAALLRRWIQLLPDGSVPARRPGLVPLGLFRFGGVVGITNNTGLSPHITLLINRLVQEQAPSCCYTSIAVSCDCRQDLHRDSQNEATAENTLVVLEKPVNGGGVWVQLGLGDVVQGQISERCLEKGGTILGQTLPLSSSPIRFCPRVWHAIEDYPQDQPRLVLVAYSSQGLSKLSVQNPQSYERLCQLGFPVPSPDSASLALLHVAEEAPGRNQGESMLEEPYLCCCGMPALGAEFARCPQQGESLASLKFKCGAEASEIEASKAGQSTDRVHACSKEAETCNTAPEDFSEESKDGVSDRSSLVRLCVLALKSNSNPCDQASRDSCMPACVEAWRSNLSSSSEGSWCEVSSLEALEPIEPSFTFPVEGEEFGAEEQVQEHALKPEARIILEGRRLASISAMREQEQALVKELQSGHVELAQSTAELLEQMDNSVSCLESLLESLSGQAVSEWESEGLLRSDVHLRALDAEADVLQTKMVPIAEVAKDIDSWKPSLSDELASVTTVHKAGVIISEEEARLLESNPDVEVLRVPGKIVASIKPPFKRKARFVACGNYLTRQKESKSPTLDRHDLYSAGLDSFALRTQLAIGAYKSWKCASLDVKTAFLTAPLQQPRATGKTRKERIVLVRVPRVMVLAGLVPPGSWMRVEGALYGLQESPHSWGSFRDGKLQCLTWCTPSGEKVGLEQCAADVSVWLIKSGGLVVGTLGVYVDDLLVMTQSEHLMPTLDAIRSLWKCSDPEYASKQGGFRFCGLQIEERSGMIWIHQRDYLVDLFSKYPHLKSSSVLPQFKEEPPAETPTASTVQYAQRIIGELTWVSGRSRLDISFSVNKLSRYTTKCPSFVVSCGEQVIRYLMFTVDYCLCYGPSLVVPEDFLAELPSVRNDAVLETWADASFAAQEDGDSPTGVIVTLVGMPVAWLSLRQPCVALSTCEAEVVSCIEGVCLTRALRPLIEEMLGQVVTWHLLNDSVSCSAVLAFPGGSWRTKHLRLRARAIRESLDAEELTLSHIPGRYMLADLLTKPLSSARIRELLGYMACQGLSSDVPGKGSGERGAAKCATSKPTAKNGTKLRLLVGASCLCTSEAQPLSWVQVEGGLWLWVVGCLVLVCIALCVWESWRRHRTARRLQMLRDIADEVLREATSDELQEGSQSGEPEPEVSGDEATESTQQLEPCFVLRDVLREVGGLVFRLLDPMGDEVLELRSVSFGVKISVFIAWTYVVPVRPLLDDHSDSEVSDDRALWSDDDDGEDDRRSLDEPEPVPWEQSFPDRLAEQWDRVHAMFSWQPGYDHSRVRRAIEVWIEQGGPVTVSEDPGFRTQHGITGIMDQAFRMMLGFYLREYSPEQPVPVGVVPNTVGSRSPEGTHLPYGVAYADDIMESWGVRVPSAADDLTPADYQVATAAYVIWDRGLQFEHRQMTEAQQAIYRSLVQQRLTEIQEVD